MSTKLNELFIERTSSFIHSFEQYSVENTSICNSLIPASLIEYHDHHARAIVLRALYRLKHFLQEELKPDEESSYFNNIEIEHFNLILCCILYAKYDSSAGWEWRAGEKTSLTERIRQDCDRLGWEKIVEEEKKEEEKNKITLISQIISLHKLATYLPTKRFSKKLYDKITQGKFFCKDENRKLLGIVAACCYDSPNEHIKNHQKKRAKDIIESWSKNYKVGLEVNGSLLLDSEFVFLYDLPICKVSPANAGSRESFVSQNELNYDSLIAFINNKKNGGNANKFISFHYDQSRKEHINFDGENSQNTQVILDELEIEKINIAPGNGIYEGTVNIYEIRLKRINAINKLFNSIFTAVDIPDDNFWIEALNLLLKTATFGKSENSSFKDWISIFPQPNYFPLPLFDTICSMAYKYEGRSNCYKIIAEFNGMLDSEFPRRMVFNLPVLDNCNDKQILTRIRALYINAISAHIVNAGVLAGFQSVRVWNEEKETTKIIADEITSGVNELVFRKVENGYEILVHSFIEPFMRSIDIMESSVKDEITSNEYKEKFFKDPRRISNLIKKNNDFYALGVDIGATSVKIELHNRDTFFGWNKEKKYLKSFRYATAKNTNNSSEKFKTLKEFMERLFDKCNSCIQEYNKDQENNKDSDSKIKKIYWNDIELIGITWPGALRNGKIAGTSGIFKHFEEHVASMWMRRMTVDKLRKLNPVSEFENVIRNKLFETEWINTLKSQSENSVRENLNSLQEDNKELFELLLNKKELQEKASFLNKPLFPVIGLVNDGTGEILSRISFGYSPFRKHRWCLLKLGTGTASMVIDHGIPRNGIMEFGKLTNNIYVPTDGKHLINDEDKTSVGVNEEASMKLLPNILVGYLKSSNSGKNPLPPNLNIDSYDIGRIGEFLFSNKSKNNKKTLDTLIRELGQFYIYKNHLSTEFDKEHFSTLLKQEDSAIVKVGSIDSKILTAINRTGYQKAKELCFNIGLWRLKEILRNFASKETTDFEKYEKFFLDEENLKSFRNSFHEIFKLAGIQLAEVVMLIRTYYQNDGIIFSGGVLPETISSSELIKNVTKHLKSRYGIVLESFEKYSVDKKFGRIGKNSFTTIYSNLKKENGNGNWQIKTYDKGERGGIIMASLKKFIDKIQPEVNLYMRLNEDKVYFYKKLDAVDITNVQTSEFFVKSDYMAVVVVAVCCLDKVYLFRRNDGFDQELEYLYLSGKITDLDKVKIADSDNIDLKETVQNCVRREIEEEIHAEIKGEIKIGPVVFQPASDRESKSGFAFFLTKVELKNDLLPNKNRFKWSESIRDAVVFVPDKENKNIGKLLKSKDVIRKLVAKDSVFKKMTTWLAEQN